MRKALNLVYFHFGAGQSRVCCHVATTTSRFPQLQVLAVASAVSHCQHHIKISQIALLIAIASNIFAPVIMSQDTGLFSVRRPREVRTFGALHPELRTFFRSSIRRKL